MNDTINLPVPPFKILERTLTALTRRRALRTFVQRLPLGWIGALDPLVSVAQRPEAKRWQKTTRPPRNDHISHPAKKTNASSKVPWLGYVSSQEVIPNLANSKWFPGFSAVS